MAHQPSLSSLLVFCHSDQSLVLFKHFSLFIIKMSAYRFMKTCPFCVIYPSRLKENLQGECKSNQASIKKKKSCDYFLYVVLYHFTFSICLFHIIHYLTLSIFNHFWLLINKHALMSRELALHNKLYRSWKTGFGEAASLFGTCIYIQ